MELPILLPSGFTPIIQTGAIITIGQTIAEQTGRDEEIVNIAKIFSLTVHRAAKTLKKNPGDRVRSGDVLAVKKSLFGVEKEALISKFDGTILSYERGSGNLFIKPLRTAVKQMISPVAGTVTMCNNERIVIGTDKNVLAADGGWGKTAEGEIFVLQQSFSAYDTSAVSESVLFQLDSRAIGKVVVAKALTKDFLLKGIAIGTSALIGEDISETDLAYVEGKKLAMPILSVNTQSLHQLLQWEGRKVFVDAKTKAIILLQT